MDNALQVSWIRKKDYHLLTVGLATYSSDERFSATHLKQPEVNDLFECYVTLTYYRDTDLSIRQTMEVTIATKGFHLNPLNEDSDKDRYRYTSIETNKHNCACFVASCRAAELQSCNSCN